MDLITKEKVKNYIIGVMTKFEEIHCDKKPFDKQLARKTNPFGVRLVPIEVWKGAKLERSFVTTFGNAFERIGKIIAEGTGAQANNRHKSIFTLTAYQIDKIEEILSALRENEQKPNWGKEVAAVQTLKTGKRIQEVTVISDLFIKRIDGKEEYYSFKTAKPNLDQTERAKRDLLRLKAFNLFCITIQSGRGRPSLLGS
jgi:hypothetical protein